MQVVTADLISGKKVLLRYDIDVQIIDRKVTEDFKLKAGLDTLRLCLENAAKVIMIGHVGRPFANTKEEQKGNPAEFSAKPIQEWFEKELGIKIEFATTLEQANLSSKKFVLLENIRFFHGEVPGADYHATCVSKTCDVDFAHQLAQLGEVYVNEAFSAHNKAASTTMIPTLMPHFAGIHFIEEVEVLLNVRNNPKKPFVAIMGGAKVKDKLPVINVMAEKADAVLVGGKLIHEIREENLQLPKNVLVGKLNEDGFDIASETTSAWAGLINKAAQIVWNGPLGKVDSGQWTVDSLGSAKGTYEISKMVLESSAEIVVGGGDSIAFLNEADLLKKFQARGFVSVGGGAMLKLISDGTLPTIEALNFKD